MRDEESKAAGDRRGYDGSRRSVNCGSSVHRRRVEVEEQWNEETMASWVMLTLTGVEL